MMRRITIDIPATTELSGLSQSSRSGREFWRCWLRPRGELYLQGGSGSGPQEAADAAAAALKRGQELWEQGRAKPARETKPIVSLDELDL